MSLHVLNLYLNLDSTVPCVDVVPSCESSVVSIVRSTLRRILVFSLVCSKSLLFLCCIGLGKRSSQHLPVMSGWQPYLEHSILGAGFKDGAILSQTGETLVASENFKVKRDDVINFLRLFYCRPPCLKSILLDAPSTRSSPCLHLYASIVKLLHLLRVLSSICVHVCSS